jgi:hypothetical protein
MKLFPATKVAKLRFAFILVLGMALLGWFHVLDLAVIRLRWWPREGDVVFQSLPHGDLVDAIEGISQSPFSHCGVVVRGADGGWRVIEAIGDVHETPLNLCALGLIYIVAFSDTSEERWQHFYVVFASAAFLGTCLAFAKKREDRMPLPLIVRRLVWGGVLVMYACALLLILRLGSSAFARFSDTLRLICYLGSTAPFAYLVWGLLRSKRG